MLRAIYEKEQDFSKKSQKYSKQKKTFRGLIYLYTYICSLARYNPFFILHWLTLASCNFYCFGNSSIMVLNLRLQPMFVHILIVVEKKPLLLFEVELLRHVQQQCSLHYGSFIKCVVAGFCNSWKNIFMKSPTSFLNSIDFL